MDDKYIRDYVQRIRNANDREEVADIVEQIYLDGYEDGINTKPA